MSSIRVRTRQPGLPRRKVWFDLEGQVIGGSIAYHGDHLAVVDDGIRSHFINTAKKIDIDSVSIGGERTLRDVLSENRGAECFLYTDEFNVLGEIEHIIGDNVRVIPNPHAVPDRYDSADFIEGVERIIPLDEIKCIRIRDRVLENPKF